MKLTDLTLQTMLANLIETGNIFDPATCFIGIATNIVDDGAATVMADVTEGTGDLADRIAITAWTLPYKLSDGRWVVDSNVAQFSPASSAEQAQISNWFIATLVAAGVLKAWGTIFPAVGLANEHSVLSLVVRITIDPDGRWDQSIYWNG